MGRNMPVTDQLSVYVSVVIPTSTAATVEVTATQIKLVLTNAGTFSRTMSSYATVTLLAAAITAAHADIQAQVVGSGNSDPTELSLFPATNCLALANIQYLQGRNTEAYEQAIDSASDLIERHCNRTFAETDYRQGFHGNERPELQLRQWPVTALTRVSIGVQYGLEVKNTSTDAYDATVKCDGTNITLTLVGGANDSTASPTTVALSSNTITELAVLITAEGNGWTASAYSTIVGSMLATELLNIPPRKCLTTTAYVPVPEESEDELYCDMATAILRRNYAQAEWGFARPVRAVTRPYYPERSAMFWPGNYNVIVSYTAGYATIPDDLAQICNEVAATMLRQGTRDTGLRGESASGYSYSSDGSVWLTEGAKERLQRWRMYRPPQYVDL